MHFFKFWHEGLLVFFIRGGLLIASVGWDCLWMIFVSMNAGGQVDIPDLQANQGQEHKVRDSPEEQPDAAEGQEPLPAAHSQAEQGDNEHFEISKLGS